MIERIGKDLERLLDHKWDSMSEENAAQPLVEGPHLFHNRERLKLFVYLHYKPCSTAKEISNFLGLGRTATEWHLKSLIKAGYIMKMKIGGWNVYHPSVMSRPDECTIFGYLNIPVYRRIFMEIIHNPGSCLKELARRFSRTPAAVLRPVNALADIGLIEKSRDGRFVRIYPTGLFQNMAHSFNSRQNLIVSSVLDILETDGVVPIVIMHSDEWIEVSIVTARADRSSVRFPLNPYLTILSE